MSAEWRRKRDDASHYNENETLRNLVELPQVPVSDPMCNSAA
jgi:hypothetical protein